MEQRKQKHSSSTATSAYETDAPEDAAPVTPDEAENTDATMTVTDDETSKPAAEHLTTEEVRQGHTGDHVRYILATSVVGIVIVFAVVYLYFIR
ncbi:hypothetical protein [Hyphococcus sp.]|uniref:hypothetical protein n=1 Tax=Hyphococcus sp. TaxID=2038636 RepID=UPI003CCB764F